MLENKKVTSQSNGCTAFDRLVKNHRFIPTRRVKSISKLFCIEGLIRRGFI